MTDQLAMATGAAEPDVAVVPVSVAGPAAPAVPDSAAGPHTAGGPGEEPAADLIAGDLLVEEVSIDGMCGVY